MKEIAIFTDKNNKKAEIMSMSLIFYTVDDADIEVVLNEPFLLDILYDGELLNPEDFENFNDAQKDKIINWKPKVQKEKLFVGSSFQALHYFLTSETEWGKGDFPYNFLTGARINIGEIGWGSTTFYTSDDVKKISDMLKGLDDFELIEKYNPDFFNKNKIYPRGYKWQKNDINTLLQELMEISNFVLKACSENLGIFRVLM